MRRHGIRALAFAPGSSKVKGWQPPARLGAGTPLLTVSRSGGYYFRRAWRSLIFSRMDTTLDAALLAHLCELTMSQHAAPSSWDGVFA